jgi:hypothetical protein
MKTQVLGLSLTWCVTTAWGSSPCIHLLPLGWFPAYTYYVLLLVVNPFLELLKLDQNCLSVIFCLTWSVWAFASTCICCYTHITVPVRASFQSDCYTPEASAFLHPFVFIAYFEGMIVFQSLISACVNKGESVEKYPRRSYWVHAFMWEIAFVQGELHFELFLQDVLSLYLF